MACGLRRRHWTRLARAKARPGRAGEALRSEARGQRDRYAYRPAATSVGGLPGQARVWAQASAVLRNGGSTGAEASVRARGVAGLLGGHDRGSSSGFEGHFGPPASNQGLQTTSGNASPVPTSGEGSSATLSRNRGIEPSRMGANLADGRIGLGL